MGTKVCISPTPVPSAVPTSAPTTTPTNTPTNTPTPPQVDLSIGEWFHPDNPIRLTGWNAQVGQWTIDTTWQGHDFANPNNCRGCTAVYVRNPGQQLVHGFAVDWQYNLGGGYDITHTMGAENYGSCSPETNNSQKDCTFTKTLFAYPSEYWISQICYSVPKGQTIPMSFTATVKRPRWFSNIVTDINPSNDTSVLNITTNVPAYCGLPTPTSTPAPTSTPTNTPTPTPTNTPTSTPTSTPTNTPTPLPTVTGTPPPSSTPTPTPTDVPTSTPTPTCVFACGMSCQTAGSCTDDCSELPGCNLCSVGKCIPRSPSETPVPNATNTNTPIPTEIPTPTGTTVPIPTATSIPPPTATPTIPEGACKCHGTTMAYTGDLGPGTTVTVTTKTRIEDLYRGQNKVDNMVYHVKKNGAEVTDPSVPLPSDIIPAVIQPDETYEGKTVTVYQTSWSYQIPSTGIGLVTYEIWAQVNCGWLPAQAGNTSSVVLGEQTSNQSFFGSILNFFNNLLNRSDNLAPQSVPSPTPTATPPLPTPTPTVAAGFMAKSLKLGAFTPASSTVETFCDHIQFDIEY